MLKEKRKRDWNQKVTSDKVSLEPVLTKIIARITLCLQGFSWIKRVSVFIWKKSELVVVSHRQMKLYNF